MEQIDGEVLNFYPTIWFGDSKNPSEKPSKKINSSNLTNRKIKSQMNNRLLYNRSYSSYLNRYDIYDIDAGVVLVTLVLFANIQKNYVVAKKIFVYIKVSDTFQTIQVSWNAIVCATTIMLENGYVCVLFCMSYY